MTVKTGKDFGIYSSVLFRPASKGRQGVLAPLHNTQ